METVSIDRREYVLVRPISSNVPLLVFLHGMGCTAEWAVDETRLDTFARERGFALVAPQAQRPKPDAPAKFLTNAPRWNDGSNSAAEFQFPDDVQFLDTVISDALERTKADPHRVYLAGFSNGAGMTFRYAATRSERLAAIAPVAGHCWQVNAQLAHSLPTLYLIGTHDPLIPLRGGEIALPWGNRLVHRPPVLQTLERWATVNGCSRDSILERDENSIREERFPGPVEFRAVTVAGLGHHWPGGKGQLNPRIGGPTSNMINANELLWDFFRKFTTEARRHGENPE